MSQVTKKYVLKDFDFSNITEERTFQIFYGKEPNLVSVHIDWEDLTGDLDGKVQLVQKNDPNLNWAMLSDLDTLMIKPSDSIILENPEWGGEVLGLRITPGKITGGTLNVVVIAKDK